MAVSAKVRGTSGGSPRIWGKVWVAEKSESEHSMPSRDLEALHIYTLLRLYRPSLLRDQESRLLYVSNPSRFHVQRNPTKLPFGF